MASAAATAYAYHHVILAPKLPQQDDRSTAHDLTLVDIAIHALQSLKPFVSSEHVGSVEVAVATVENLRRSRDHHGNNSESQVQHILANVANGVATGLVPLEIKEQNAGILVGRSSNNLVFEFFELSPTNEAAMHSGRLVREFPAHASQIPIGKVKPDLIESISRTIATMTTQTAPGFQPKITKNKKIMDEQRDTTHPGMVTDFLMSMITAFGEPTDVRRSTKYTREEVLWKDCFAPWRRSPLWLLLRVSLQLLFARQAPSTLHTDGLYKAFMIFVLTRLLDLGKQHWEDMGSEAIHIILAKLSRRLRKFELLKQEGYLRPVWAQHIHDRMINAHVFINQHWQDRIANSQANIDFSTISQLKPKADVDMDLSGLDAFLLGVTSRQREVSSSTFTPTSEYPSYLATQLPDSIQSSSSPGDRYFRLAAFEKWVEHHLADWYISHLHDEDACGRLRSIMTSYYDIASSTYAGAPVGLSIMYLTLTELWIACDQIARTIYPMLVEYDPEVDLEEFQCLTLPLKSHLNRLNASECYLRMRRDSAVKGRPSVYREFGDPASFAVRYFDQCEALQDTLSEIEVDATAKRKQKCEELVDLKRQYQQYMDRYNSNSCEEVWETYNYRYGYKHKVHSSYCSRCAAKRSADGLTIQIYEWPVSPQVTVAKATVFELMVPGSYSNWRDASAHFITTVLGHKDANQLRPSCSYTLNNHHDLAHRLTSLYHERRVIPLSQVKSHTATHRRQMKAIPQLNDDDVCLKNALRYAYYDVSSGIFNTSIPGCTQEVPKKCLHPLPKRSKALERFMYRPPTSPDGLPANEVVASLSDCPTHFSIDEYKALGALPLGNNIIHPNILAQLAIPSVDYTKIETQCIVLQAVYQAGPPSQCIGRSGHSILTEASFGHAVIAQLETNLGRIEENWESWRAAATFSLLARRVLSLTLAPEVRSRALDYLETLRAVCLRWLRRLKERVAASTDDGQRTELWSRATEVALLCTSTYDVEETDFETVLQQESAISTLLQSSIVVQEHCGTMQSDFPELFSISLQSWKSLMYRILQTLRNLVLKNHSGLSDAIKANWAAFEESNPSNSWSSLDENHQKQWLLTTSGSLPVHFNLLTGELLVNGLPLARLPAEYERHRMYEPLFHKSALEVVPTDEIGFRFSAKALYQGYSLHFGMKGEDMILSAIGQGKRRLELSFVTDALLLRPLYSPWSTEDDDTRWRLDKVMISVRSKKPLHMHMRLIELPRLQISFEFTEASDRLRSRQFRDMIIDSDQTMGGLVGMQSRLILRSDEVSFTKGDLNHPEITGDGSLRSRLILCYLHALTSHCLPDPLTGCTGTESAISILRSAAVGSTDLLTPDDIDLLTRLAALSATRSFYPKDLKVMQMRLFYPDKYNDFGMITHAQKELLSSSTAFLDERFSNRTATFHVAGFGAEHFTSARDLHYRKRASATANLILRDSFSLHTRIPDLKSRLLQKHFKYATILGVNRAFDSAGLRSNNHYDMITWLCTMSYAETSDMDVIQALAAFYRVHELSTVQSPIAPKFELAKGHVYHKTTIENIVQNNTKPFEESDEARSQKMESETEQQHHNRMESTFRQQKISAIQKFVSCLEKQWPMQVPISPQAAEIDTYVNVPDAMVTVRNHFYSWYDNHIFMKYLGELSTIMARQAASPVLAPRHILTSPPKQNQLSDSTRHLSVLDVFASSPSPSIEALSMIAPSEPAVTVAKGHLPEKHLEVKERLEELCRRNMVYATSKCEREYIESLRSSCNALNLFINSNVMHDELVADVQTLLHAYLRKCQNHLETFNSALKGLFSHQVAFPTQLSPRLCTKFWLSQLHRDRFDTLSSAWKETVIQYALSITNLQRAQRLLRLSKKPVDLVEELRHVGHSNWDVHQYPETLLIEAESGILVRAEQEFIADQMRSPKDGWNIVLQLLMGGGKSSTILPILSAYHGDKKKLVRVVIAKPQSRQMLQMLVAKLGGLLNRKVYQMPFSRNLRLSAQDAQIIREIYEECIRERGVLLIQPEHILSFKLMAVECVLIDQPETAQKMLETQQWFDDVSCDCIDESDENFSTKFELIYTMGSQSSIEYAPERWLIIQDLLALIPTVAEQVKKIHPEAIDVEGDGDGRYPRIRFLRPDAADLVLRLLAKKVVRSGVGSPSRSQCPQMQAAILHYISVTELKAHEIETVEQSKFWTETTKPALLLLRGLFAGGVLNFVFSQKRYRVNFGLDSSRTPTTRLAVPYRSKDSPSPRSEYSHPDVLILLSLLSWYYEGLGNEDLFDTLIHLLKSDQGAIHFDEFVSTASSSLPKAFRQLSGISIRDRHQCAMEVFPGLRYSKKAVDYFLSRLVFPKELKQFPSKLSASGWDLAIRKPNPTTGFSGTNDTRHLLPLNMHQLDLPSQQHTNARVLSYLLMNETSVAHLPPRSIGSTSTKDGQHLLTFIEGLHPDIRVILDCGASILDMNNREVAEAWLKLRDNDVAAVVYFEDEELSVLDRSSKIESFQTSPYAKMLDSCVVYLDESHTRGTDIPGLPRHYRAALTLGSQLTKDRLTQAAMRLRKLGNGQSVCFVVPGEIRTRIYERNGKPPGTPIDVYDVLAWAIGETWSDLKRSLPLWAVQGNRFESHKHLLLDGASTTKEQAEAFLEDEAASLETRYKPREPDNDGSKHLRGWDESNENIVKIVSRCRDFEAMGFGSAALSEEQERELAPEIEEQRQIERPPRLKAHPHSFHPDLKRLINRGEFCVSSKAWGPAFEALCTTSAAKDVDLSKFPDDLLVTADFMHTVQVPPGSTRASFVSDSYQRPVQFVLSIHRQETVSNLIIVSPYEANQLLPLLRQSKTVCLHIFAPRSNASYASVDDLMLYNVGRTFLPGSVSRSLTMQLNLFAGSLYLRSLSECAEICDHLGLLKGTAKDGQEVYADGFIDPPTGIWRLEKSPVPFLRALLMKIRREGEGVEKTHLGRMLSGVQLEESDFMEEE
ncbi:hypothetical protein BKA58DRAFT_448898 [Alternaria rosae]|uniref:uncharacterized protein n=1 Tax=Alternaria rosae TaxID=1187941 RepID=UPI001E8E37B3|nr:uncharacterized protein BKA58DRAFT_448898 [Alternaria rosae]KAH6861099.1 hypothetical protein BKA58DRAFT_448898 [Alternaria rosae]